MEFGKRIELFLESGNPDGIIIAELSNWNGKAVKIPRIEVSDCKREDIKEPGVYFLFCKDDDGGDSVYIGEAENVKDRLIQHLSDYKNGKEKYEWNTALILFGRELNKTLIRYLEDRFVDITKKCNRYRVLTKNTYKNTVIKESYRAEMEEYIFNARVLINTLGYKILEPYVEKIEEVSGDKNLLHISKGNASATGKITTEGFVVYKGAKINENSSNSLSEGMKTLRNKLIKEQKIVNLELMEDYLFSSSSAASDFVLGYSSSGPLTWKNEEGISLKDIDI